MLTSTAGGRARGICPLKTSCLLLMKNMKKVTLNFILIVETTPLPLGKVLKSCNFPALIIILNVLLYKYENNVNIEKRRVVALRLREPWIKQFL
jgi:hypothetical protein